MLMLQTLSIILTRCSNKLVVVIFRYFSNNNLLSEEGNSFGDACNLIEKWIMQDFGLP